ncbi:Laminin subunit alpha-2 precursor [Helicobacter pylori]|uniref:Laminin subunit alpha-2 precursor n=1 Tax=Helicobacter pylori TaxID=210 RepID=UPI0013DDBC3B|nr:Laminin subunit alpha-2 precursor [Helicobacter pylori]QTO94819.1 Laminin subunit alpha-2 precursor [Helicobacter pylori]WQS20106.1 Laminin subunit alpha-2 precursor [Helicobacter pylori]WQU41393.1 Laminin subunit alpha-2 precursor [Helicobacter pylori]
MEDRMSKISNNYNPSLTMRDYHSQRVSPRTRKEENKEIQNLSENDEKIKLAKQAKQDNLAIGDLESRLKSLKGMDKDAKELVGISKSYAHNNEKDRSDFERFKSRLDKAIDSFNQNLDNGAASLKLPSNIDIDDTKALEKFSKSLESEKESIQNSLHQWKKQLAETNHLNKEYNTLDKTRLNAQKFQDVHDTSKITPSRLQDLLA